MTVHLAFYFKDLRKLLSRGEGGTFLSDKRCLQLGVEFDLRVKLQRANVILQEKQQRIYLKLE